jgi:hypothetical protein
VVHQNQEVEKNSSEFFDLPMVEDFILKSSPPRPSDEGLGFKFRRVSFFPHGISLLEKHSELKGNHPCTDVPSGIN